MELLKNLAYIDGQWSQSLSGASYEVCNPATGQVIGQVPDMGKADTVQAITAANAAWSNWRALTAKERSLCLSRWYELIMAHRDALAHIVTAECGKPLAESLGEVTYAASFITWFAEEAKRVYGDIIPGPSTDRRILVMKEAIGVCAAITPWNFPLAMITRKVSPALAAGCTSVLKPAEATPFSALALAELAERAGIPPGVFNVVTAAKGQEVGQELCTNPLVRKFSFTGSTATGKLLLRQCADTVKRVSMELGGNAPFIVFDDADLDLAVKGAMASKYRNAGQTCVCANRFYIQSGVYDAFVDKLVDAVDQLVVGPGDEAHVTQGPLINAAGLAKVETHVADALSKGAKIACGGQRHQLGGNFYQPTVLTEVTENMRLAQEETFGPVAPLFRFSTTEEVIAMANNTSYGLAAYCYSRDLAQVIKMSEALEFGMVGINEGVISSEVAPFGGVKESGIGREGSKYGLDEYLEVKYVCLAGL